ncbi:GntR family transcriptional regulator [Propionimicrobium sp. PCR01-08-3]|uniref:GntR family transcriptional regulator n=1 Tax=Propionimicrobium sp. PCR01-08-3 TaxID=3052086 RepID=UPI00255CA4BC|nr:GntR family transcriptional regulator [Propionimicrobium sp. PCR01-08-3]WIY82122.1 GntR family transcriptional regulator [Propionimicrobium sp. PCR01-08-3]
MELAKLGLSKRMGDQVFDAIRDAIMNGDLPGGQRLQIRQVAEQLGTSVMPVREAIRRLESTGLVESQPYRGAVVKDFTTIELLDVYAVLRLLEAEAAALGASHASVEDVQRSRELLHKMEHSLADKRAIDYLDEDEECLAVIYSAAGNPFLVETIKQVWQRCRSYKILGARRAISAEIDSDLLSYRERLVDAAQAQDAEMAAEATRGSLDAATTLIQTALAAAARK